MSKPDIGILGLGLMGRSLALNLAGKGFSVALFNPPLPGEESVVEDILNAHPEKGFLGGTSFAGFVESLKKPRKILLMVKSGKPVDVVIQQLVPHLERGDIVIDGGNSFYKDSIRRHEDLGKKGIYFVGMGVSGGEKGALLGPSMMPSGSLEIKDHLLPILEKMAAKFQNEPCVNWIGGAGSGHFVKMVHNGIEYADMQILSETYAILKNIYGDNNGRIADHLVGWKNSLHNSFLLDITIEILRHKEEDIYLLDKILDVGGHKGTGLWTIQSALELGIATPTISAALNRRILSKRKDLRLKLSRDKKKSQAMTAENREILIEHLNKAILTARLIALAEGFFLLKEAFENYQWDLSLPGIAKLWRGGCIIRSDMLPAIIHAFEKEKSIAHLFESESYFALIKEGMESLKEVTAITLEQDLPLPALYATFQYFETMREARLPVNLLQAQRDYFGAHGYQREDKEGSFHTNWNG